MRWGNGTNGSVQAYRDGVTLEASRTGYQEHQLVFDEAQNASGGPDRFGVAILDNVNVNGLVAGNREIKHWWGWNFFWGW